MSKFRQEVLTSVGMILGTSPMWQSWGTHADETEAVKLTGQMYAYSSSGCPRRVVELDDSGRVVRVVETFGEVPTNV